MSTNLSAYPKPRRARISVPFWGVIFSLALSGLVFVAFNHTEVASFIRSFGKGVPDPDFFGRMTLPLLQSFVIFVVGTFLTVFLSRFESIELRLNDALTGLPDRITSSVSSVGLQLNSELDRLRQSLAHGMVHYGKYVYRALRYDENSGVLFNHTSNDDDAPRNVLFNNKTISVLLANARSQGVDLELLGHQCGLGFGGFLDAFLKQDGANVDLARIIDGWIEYDSNAGFGNFSRHSNADSKMMSIKLKYNFLTEIQSLRDPNESLCPFMTGYLNGVLATLPADTIRRSGFRSGKLVATHDTHSEDCVCTSRNQSKGCTWQVIEPPSS